MIKRLHFPDETRASSRDVECEGKKFAEYREKLFGRISAEIVSVYVHVCSM